MTVIEDWISSAEDFIVDEVPIWVWPLAVITMGAACYCVGTRKRRGNTRAAAANAGAGAGCCGGRGGRCWCRVKAGDEVPLVKGSEADGDIELAGVGSLSDDSGTEDGGADGNGNSSETKGETEGTDEGGETKGVEARPPPGGSPMIFTHNPIHAAAAKAHRKPKPAMSVAMTQTSPPPPPPPLKKRLIKRQFRAVPPPPPPKTESVNPLVSPEPDTPELPPPQRRRSDSVTVATPVMAPLPKHDANCIVDFGPTTPIPAAERKETPKSSILDTLFEKRDEKFGAAPPAHVLQVGPSAYNFDVEAQQLMPGFEYPPTPSSPPAEWDTEQQDGDISPILPRWLRRSPAARDADRASGDSEVRIASPVQESEEETDSDLPDLECDDGEDVVKTNADSMLPRRYGPVPHAYPAPPGRMWVRDGCSFKTIAIPQNPLFKRRPLTRNTNRSVHPYVDQASDSDEYEMTDDDRSTSSESEASYVKSREELKAEARKLVQRVIAASHGPRELEAGEETVSENGGDDTYSDDFEEDMSTDSSSGRVPAPSPMTAAMSRPLGLVGNLPRRRLFPESALAPATLLS